MQMNQDRAARRVIARMTLAAWLVGVSGTAYLPAALAEEKAAATSSAVTIDGDFSDWEGTDSAETDGPYVYFRVRVPGGKQPLSNSETSLELHVDFDGNAKTGLSEEFHDKETTPAGTDVCVRYSPAKEYETRGGTRAGKGRGAAVWIAGTKADDQVSPMIKEIGHSAAGLVSAPTIVSDVYELRLDRAALVKAGCEPAGKEGTARWWVSVVTKGGEEVASSKPQTIDLAALDAKAAARPLADEIPACPEGGVRVMSYNVLFASPMKNPEPFARVLRAIKPDIVLVQEWEPRGKNEPRPGAAGITAWFNANVPLETGEWSVLDSAGWGVAVVTRHPMARLGPAKVNRGADMPGDDRGNDASVRFTGGMIESPIGPIAASSIHLKCCGSSEGREEQTRLGEAQAINKLMAAAGEKDVIRIIAGDFNLVGTRRPLEIAAAGIDADGSDLLPVPTPILGDGSFITWNDAQSEFPPSRLDYVLISDSVAKPVQSFVFDTAYLSPSALSRLNLRADDTRSSDHMPIVVDLIKAK